MQRWLRHSTCPQGSSVWQVTNMPTGDCNSERKYQSRRMAGKLHGGDLRSFLAEEREGMTSGKGMGRDTSTHKGGCRNDEHFCRGPAWTEGRGGEWDWGLGRARPCRILGCLAGVWTSSSGRWGAAERLQPANDPAGSASEGSSWGLRRWGTGDWLRGERDGPAAGAAAEVRQVRVGKGGFERDSGSWSLRTQW